MNGSDMGTASEIGVSEVEYREIREFMFAEAALLDRRQYAAWCALLTPDIRYRVTAHVARSLASAPADYAILDDDAEALRLRTEQIGNPRFTYAENPPSLTRHFVTNIRVLRGAVQNEYAVTANILVYRNKVSGSDGADLFSGEREDVLRRANGTLLLARRVVRLDLTAVPATNISTLF